MKVYTTKYALTTGIEVIEASYAGDDKKYVHATNDNFFSMFTVGKTAFLTYKEATSAAYEMRNRKILAVNKQLVRLTNLCFPIDEPENLQKSKVS